MNSSIDELAQERKEKSLSHFERTAKSYDNSADGKFVKPMYRILVDEILAAKPKTLLDVGCGNGNVLKMLEKTDTKLFGIDFSGEMIRQAQLRLTDAVELSVGDVEQLPYPDKTFDALVCNASFHHYPHPAAALVQMRRVMQKYALLFIGEGYVIQPFRFLLNLAISHSDAGDCRSYGKKELSKLLESNGFKVERIITTSDHTVLYIARAV